MYKKTHYESQLLNNLEKKILDNVHQGGDGVGARITNTGRNRPYSIKVTQEDIDKLDSTLEKIFYV